MLYYIRLVLREAQARRRQSEPSHAKDPLDLLRVVSDAGIADGNTGLAYGEKPTVLYFSVVLPQRIDKKNYEATFFQMVPSEAAMVIGANVRHFRPTLLKFALGSTFTGARCPALATELDRTARLLAIGPRRTWLI